MEQRTVRSLASAGFAAGLCWIALAGGALTGDEQADDTKVVLESTGDYVGFGIFAAALALTVPSLLALYGHHGGNLRGLGRIGVAVATIGCTAQCVVISTIAVTGEEPGWFGIAAPAAILTWFAGSVAFGVAIKRAAVLPGWVGVLLPVVTLFSIVGSNAGTSALFGVFLIVVAARLVRSATPLAPAVPAR